uniref:Uncharacterized protein n=1 Tax=Parascaris univalens TaxID=6257 RepID=A0A914ZEW1_PARUN
MRTQKDIFLHANMRIERRNLLSMFDTKKRRLYYVAFTSTLPLSTMHVKEADRSWKCFHQGGKYDVVSIKWKLVKTSVRLLQHQASLML